MEHDLSHVPVTPQWAITTGGIGYWSVIWAVLLFLATFFLCVFPKTRNSKLGNWTFTAATLLVFTAFSSLATLFLTDQFAYRYIRNHSELKNEVYYKFASVWSGQEGSFLLWLTASSLFALLALRGTGKFRAGYLSACSLILATIGGMLYRESPFWLTYFQGKPYVPADGGGLPPSLYNYWVIIHPPTIFLGFGSLIVLFAYAFSALANKDLDSWIPQVRPWAILSSTFVGLGLIMGGFWAYEMLNWGGFWMWDPVENVSFVPWVLSIAFFHGILVQQSRRKWHYTNVLFGALPFLSFCYGTFLTRSGYLGDTSVHNFTEMDRDALKLLIGQVVILTVGFIGFWLTRMAKDKTERPDIRPEAPLAKEKFYGAGMILLLMMGIATALGMSVPLIQSIMQRSPKAVEEHLYHQVLSWMFIPIMVLIAVTPFISWRGLTFRETLNKVINTFSISLFITGVALIWIQNPASGVQPDTTKTIHFWNGVQAPLMPWMGTLLFVCVFAICANTGQILSILRRSRIGLGGFISHVGLAVLLAGLILSRGFERQQHYVVQPGITAVPLEPKGPKDLVELINEDKLDFTNRKNEVSFKFMGNGQEKVLNPGLYYVFSGDQPMPQSRPDILKGWDHDFYVVVKDIQVDGTDFLTLKPGETGTIKGFIWATMDEVTYTVKYHNFVREGEAGKAGTKFGAKLTISKDGASVDVTPMMVLGGNSIPVQIDSHYMINMQGMNAADQSVELGLRYIRPLFLVDAFYKPFTSLVWVGTGILTFGGLLSVWNRRFRRRPETPVSESEAEESVAEEITEQINDDALVPTS